MRTLDEVIKAFEICADNSTDCGGCPYETIENNGCQVAEQKKDALHYLKVFRDAKDALDAEREKTIEAYCQWKDAKEKLEAQTSQMMWVDKHFQFEISDNPPLTMEYFSKQIDTEPIWCEKLGEWYLFLAYDDGENEIQLMSDKGDIETFNEEDLEKYPLYRRK